jgi:hypothetical protein
MPVLCEPLHCVQDSCAIDADEEMTKTSKEISNSTLFKNILKVPLKQVANDHQNLSR